MVGRRRPQLRRELGPTRVPELVGVHSQREPQRLGRGEHAARFLRRERAAIAEHVDVVRQPVVRHGREHVLADALYEPSAALFAVVARVLRNRVGGETGRLDPKARCAEASGDSKLAKLGLYVQAVAAFDLERRRAGPSHPADPRDGLGVEVVFARGPGLANARQDAAALGEDLLVVGPSQAHLELVPAVTSPNHMCVGIDQPRHQRLAPAVDDLGVAMCFGDGVLWPDPGDQAVLVHRDAGVLHDPERLHRFACAGPGGAIERQDGIGAGEELSAGHGAESYIQGWICAQLLGVEGNRLDPL